MDSFQGKQMDVVIMSCVRASEPGQQTGIGFVADIRRLNVAITRAKRALWILGSAATLKVSSNTPAKPQPNPSALMASEPSQSCECDGTASGLRWLGKCNTVLLIDCTCKYVRCVRSTLAYKQALGVS